MKQLVAATFCLVHILTFAVCTYVAALDIGTILVTGWICSGTGIAAGIACLVSGQKTLAFVLLLTPVIAATLTWLEWSFLHLGPAGAALPFSIVFIAVQLVTNLVSFRSLNFDTESKQISIRTMLLATAAFSIFFAVAGQLLQRQHDTIMLIALSLAGLTFVGVVLTLSNMAKSLTRQNAT